MTLAAERTIKSALFGVTTVPTEAERDHIIIMVNTFPVAIMTELDTRLRTEMKCFLRVDAMNQNKTQEQSDGISPVLPT